MTPTNALQEVALRPFYGEFAWAYDDLVARPVADECAGMAAALARRGIGPGATLLDAGCGTGRYAVELARRGFGDRIDRSPRCSPRRSGVRWMPAARVRFESGDLLALPGGGIRRDRLPRGAQRSRRAGRALGGVRGVRARSAPGGAPCCSTCATGTRAWPARWRSRSRRGAWLPRVGRSCSAASPGSIRPRGGCSSPSGTRSRPSPARPA